MMLKEKFQKVTGAYKKYVRKTFEIYEDNDFMDDEVMNQICTTRELTNDFCDLMVDTAETIDEQQQVIHLMYEEIKEIRRLIEKES